MLIQGMSFAPLCASTDPAGPSALGTPVGVVATRGAAGALELVDRLTVEVAAGTELVVVIVGRFTARLAAAEMLIGVAGLSVVGCTPAGTAATELVEDCTLSCTVVFCGDFVTFSEVEDEDVINLAPASAEFFVGETVAEWVADFGRWRTEPPALAGASSICRGLGDPREDAPDDCAVVAVAVVVVGVDVVVVVEVSTGRYWAAGSTGLRAGSG